MHKASYMCAVAFGLMVMFAGEASAQAKLPDLTGTYDNPGDFSTSSSAVLAKPGQTICVRGCEPTPGAGASAAPGARLVMPTPVRPKYKPEFVAKVKDLDDRQVDEDTTLRCASPGVPRIGAPEKIVQSAYEVVLLYEDITGPYFRVVPIGGKHRTDLGRTPLGDSVARWEGDTLVIETVNLTEDTWLADDGAFHTKDLRVEERLRVASGGGLDWKATSYDPTVLAEPFVLSRVLKPAKAEILVSPQCSDNSLAQMKDKSHHDNPR